MKRTERVTVMLTPKEKQYIQRRAEGEKRSVSDHVRLKYLEWVHNDEEVIPDGHSEDQLSSPPG